MKSLKYTISLALTVFSTICLYAQLNGNSNQTNKEELFRLADTWKKERVEKIKKGREILVLQGREERSISASGIVTELQGIDDRGGLLFYSTDNLDAARTLSTDKVWPGGGLGLSLSGTSMKIGEWDGGRVRISHQELVGRVNLMDSTSSIIDHATHVAGTMIAAGVDSNAKGMSYNATLDAYDWSFDDAEMAVAAANGLLISNHSYVNITGWRYNSSNSEWEWWGDTTLSGTQDYRFGFYDSQAQTWDQVARNAPYYLIVKAAGNDRGEGGSGRHYLPMHSTYSSTSRPVDGGASGYDCISTYGGAKNILTVGAVNAIPSGYSGTGSVVMSSFSGWGPTDDGRIKPDVVANGVGVYSCLGTSNTAYASWNGTSMASPNAAGSLLLLQQIYFSKHSAYMRSATLKALAIHTADEAGSFTGPDYKFGWGLINTATAALHIDDSTGNKDIKEVSINNGSTYSFSFSASGFTPIKATICWTDVPGTPVSPVNNGTTSMLVNDLDIRIIRNSDSTVYYPYILNPASPSSAATTGDNSRDNVEQIFISAPTAGSYTVVVSHKGTLTGGGSQNFSLIFDGGNIPKQALTCLLLIDSFPSIQDFESYSNCSSTSSAMCPLPSGMGWVNDSLDNIDWKVYSGSTPSTNTGPSNDYSEGTSLGKYLYTESSTSGTGFPNKQAILYSPCYDLSVLSNSELAFAYHMYGSSMGSLTVEIYNGYVWSQIWSASGDKGNQWNLAAVDISAYDGDTVQFRFIGLTGNNFLSDMAIDAIEVREKVPCPDPNNVTVYNITDSTVSFSWNSTASYWRVRLHLSGGALVIRGTINFNPVLASGLLPNTSYDIFIQDSCGGGDTSNWVGPITFRTTGLLSNPSYCGLARNIPDAGCPNLTEFPIDVATPGTQMGVDVMLREVRMIVEHTWDADLLIALKSPSNDTILLSAYNGSSNDNYGNPADTSCTQYTTFSMTASTPISLGSAPFIGSYVPEDSLTLFNNGSDPNGLWSLLICDAYSQDSGYLQYLELVFDTIVQCTGPTVAISNSGNDSICDGSSVFLSTGGGLSYQWYKNGVLMSGETSDTLQVSQTGSYNVMVTIAGGCSDSAASGYRITVNQLPTVNITNTGSSAFCAGNSTVLSASGGIAYQWYNGGSIISGATFDSILVSAAGHYNVLVTNSNLCSDSSAMAKVITVNSLPNVSINSSGSPSFCQGGSTTLSTITGAGYQWYLNGNSISGAVSSTYPALLSGSYNVLVTDSNNCSDSASNAMNVLVFPLPVVSIMASGDTVFCSGDSVVLSVSPGFNAYHWYNGGNSVPGAASFELIVRNTGFYNVYVTDLNGCSDSAALSKRVVVHALPFVAISANSTTICDGDTAVLTASSSNSYQWKKNGIAISNANSQTLFVTQAGWYNVVAINSNFCSDTAGSGVKMEVLDLPVVSLDPQPDLCNTQGSTLLSGGQPIGGIYSGNNVTGVSGQYFIDPSKTGPGTFNITYTYTDSNSCSNDAVEPLLVKNCTGIAFHKSGNEFKLYPNPTSGILFVSLPENLSGRMKISMFDINGQIALYRELEISKEMSLLQFELSELVNGVYFVHLQLDDEVWKQKVILDKN